MKQFLACLLVSVGLNAGLALASDQGACLEATAPQTKSILNADGQVANQVLCCCQTYNGQCCRYVGFCGSFIPGCMCSGHKPETNENQDANQDSELRRKG
jgi:hypothetical protein